jgi:MHS family proline/betaine transporter-like MFS transporter
MAVLSDRVGRKPTLAGSSIGLLVLGYPCFLLISQGGLFNALVGQVIMALLFAPYTAVVHATMLEMFPTRIRYSGYSVGYNISTAIFGGAAPFFITYLISVTGNDLVPAFYMVGTALFTLIAVMLITETGKVPLRDI